MLNLLLAIVVGLVGGAGLAFSMEYFADSITKPEEMTNRFHIPILGVAPRSRLKRMTPWWKKRF